MHLVNSVLWINAYHGLEALKPGELITLAVLDFFLSFESYQSQPSGDSDTCFYYLHTDTIQKLTGDPDHDKTLVKKCLDFDTLPINNAPVIFLVSFRPNTYFLALFDFEEGKVLILGRYRSGRLDPISIHAEWVSWNGSALWKRIGMAFNWLTSEIEEAQHMPVVYEANWILVYLSIISL